jgi:chromosome segregation ATPase
MDDDIKAELDAYRARTDELRREVSDHTLAIGRINAWGERMDARLERVDVRFERWELRLDRIDERFDRLDSELQRIAEVVFDILRRLNGGDDGR